MIEALKSAWALFVGLGLIMLGNGLQGTLVATRAQVENFELSVTGTVMAGYFVGFFAGSIIVPKLVANVGHVRVFGALASLASLCVLLFPVFVDPYAWFSMRLATGFCYAGLYIVAESWLNDRATNETRGQLLSLYLIISLLGMASGQYLINMFDPSEFQLFTVVSILVSLAVVPILISATKAPDFTAPETISPRKLYKISPLGVVAMVLVGMSAGIFLSMGPAYAYLVGFSVGDTSIFMSMFFFGGFLLTWPIGRASDRFDRRTIILFASAAAMAVCLIASSLNAEQKILIFLVTALMGGFAMPLYSLSIAHTNDYLAPEQMVAASATMIMANGIGAMIGPNFAGFAMEWLGPTGFFLSLTLTNGVIAAFTIWRMRARPSLPAEDQGNFVPMAPRMSPYAVVLNPEAEYEGNDETATEEGEEDKDGHQDLTDEAADGDGETAPSRTGSTGDTGSA